ncbi:dihydrofolate reductase [Sphingomonas sp. MAH-20]|uniref:Dihydrofolate reductase n=1 Tax=Sphingomonas horti TaxID=2682842 RepID=A0A6I4J2F1_9SPHN|nr:MULTISPECIES: dihydrofolate reductase family protein [Sphingomonas]MBA2918829.1 dihydrofolate reductase [Sphingomonas sp. CGMCC 1.13658]MVO78862.1 dihydrofolate reductase [Sphingomonas horti]
MRRILGGVFQSLDGVIQAPGGPNENPTGGFAHGGWLPQFFDEEVGREIDQLFARDYDLLLGRRTYDIFAAYWPHVGGEAAAMGEAFTRAGKYVLTRGNAPLSWANSHRLASIDDLATLKAGSGPDLLIQGSSTLYPQLLAAGLLDQLVLMTFPLVLGAGKRLFGDGTPGKVFRLIEHRITPKGAVIATYAPAGELTYGWAGPPVDSESEQQRQRRMAEGTW